MKPAGTDGESERSLALLLAGYGEQLRLYDHVLDLVSGENEVLLHGAPVAELTRLDERKRALLHAIDEMERRMSEPRKWLARVQRYADTPVAARTEGVGDGMAQLNDLLDQVLAAIRSIAALEVKNYELLCQPAVAVETLAMW